MLSLPWASWLDHMDGASLMDLGRAAGFLIFALPWYAENDRRDRGKEFLVLKCVLCARVRVFHLLAASELPSSGGLTSVASEC
jgi:hypothetical protein